MTLLIIWSLLTSFHQTARQPMFVTVVGQGSCWGEKQFSLFLKSSVWKVLEQEAWESHMWTMQPSTVQTKLNWIWCFKPLMLFSRAQPSPLSSMPCHSTHGRISFSRTCGSFTICMQEVLPFPFKNSSRSKCQLRHQRSFLSRLSFPILRTHWTTIFLIGSARISCKQSFATSFCYRKSARSSTRRRR